MCGSAEGVLVLYSLSKQSNMAGYRTAFIAGDESLIASMSAYRKQIGQIIPGPVAGCDGCRIVVIWNPSRFSMRAIGNVSACW